MKTMLLHTYCWLWLIIKCHLKYPCCEIPVNFINRFVSCFFLIFRLCYKVAVKYVCLYATGKSTQLRLKEKISKWNKHHSYSFILFDDFDNLTSVQCFVIIVLVSFSLLLTFLFNVVLSLFYLNHLKTYYNIYATEVCQLVCQAITMYLSVFWIWKTMSSMDNKNYNLLKNLYQLHYI